MPFVRLSDQQEIRREAADVAATVEEKAKQQHIVLICRCKCNSAAELVGTDAAQPLGCAQRALVNGIGLIAWFYSGNAWVTAPSRF